MTPEEQQKADAWMLLQDKDAVTGRVGELVAGFFENPEAAVWMANRMVKAESMQSVNKPLKNYFEGQLERNLRMILADGVQKEVAQILRPMIEAAVRDYGEQVSKDLKELKKLKSKGPIGRR